jgi:hypothetical protein
VAGLAGKPVGYLIAPILGWTGEGNVVRVSAEVGAYPGSVVPDDANRGLLLPLQSGQIDDDSENRFVRILDAGGSEGAAWIWRYQSETGTDWRGVDDVRYLTGFHAPTTQVPPGSDDCSICYSSAFRRVVFVAVDSTTNAATGPHTVYVWTQDLDVDGPTDWTSRGSFDLEGAATSSGTPGGRRIAPDYCNTRMVELGDGTLALVVRVFAPASFTLYYDYDVYHSTDGGVSWEKVADAILAPYRDLANFVLGSRSEVQFSLARSGDLLRLSWVGAGGLIYSAESSDRGVSWSAIPDASPISLFDNGDPSNPYVFDVTDVDGRGRFLLVGVVSATEIERFPASAGAPFGTVTVGQFTMIGEPKAVLCTQALGWVWIFVEVAGLLGSNAWWMARARFEESTVVGDEFEKLDSAIINDKSQWVLTRGAVVWTGDRFVFAGGNKTAATGAEIDLPTSFTATLGWSKRPIGILDYGSDWSNDSDFGGTSVPLAPGAYLPLWERQWTARQGEPGAGGGLYVLTSGGTSSATLNMNGMVIGSSTLLGRRFYTYSDATGSYPWGGHLTGLPRAFASCFEFVTGVADGSPRAPLVGEYGVEIRAPNAASSAYTEIRIRIYGTTIDVVDKLSGSTVASLTLATATTAGAMTRIRWWQNVGGGFQGQLAILDALAPDADWIVSPVATLTTSAVAPIENRLVFGNLGNTNPTAIETRWREVSWNGRDSLRQSTPSNYGFTGQTGQVNPDDLLGFAARSGYEVEVEEGLSIALAGAGGAQGDQFRAEVAHTHAGENIIAADSPRIGWRVPAPTNQLSSPSEFAGSEWTKNVGTGGNIVSDNSQTAPDGTVTASEVQYSRATGGVVTYLRALGEDQSPEASFAPTPRRGWTFSIWVRNRSGFPVDIGIRVSDGSNSNVRTIASGSGWERLRFNVPENGTTGAPSGRFDIILPSYSGGSLVVLDLWKAKLTADPEIVLAYSSEQTVGQVMEASAVAVFGCNARRLAIDTDDVSDFSSPSTATILDLARYGSESTPFGSSSTVGRGVSFSPALTQVVDREVSGQYLYAENGEGSLRAARITRYRDLGSTSIAHLDGLTGTDASVFVGSNEPSDSFAVYGESGAANTSTSLLDSFVRIRIVEQEAPFGEEDFRIGSIVLGVRKDFGVPLEWSYTDNKQPNLTSYRTRSAVSWRYREGPPQRTYTSRFVGDTSQRWRDELRFLLDEIEYEVRPVAVVFDEDRANETAILGRVVSGSEKDNAAWFEDSGGVKRTAGDQSITIVEEV